MKKIVFVLIALVFVLSACAKAPTVTPDSMIAPTEQSIINTPEPTAESTAELVIPKSPCNMAMNTDQFFQDYLGQTATFEGVYQNGSVYVFRVGKDLICTYHIGGKNSNGENLILTQDLEDANGNVDWTYNPIFASSFNGLINFTGTVTNSTVSPDLFPGDWNLYNNEPILINEKPEDCISVSDEEMKEFSEKTVRLIYANDFWADDDPWRKIAFTYGDKNYCYDSAEFEYHITITDVTGTEVVVDDPSWQGNTWFMQDMPVSFSFRSAGFVNNRTKMTFSKDVLIMQAGKVVENREFGDPMVLEFMSHGGGYTDVVGWKYNGQYSLVSGKDLDKVNPGYFVSPKEYVYGGELQVGTEIGKVGGFPIVVTALNCNPNSKTAQVNYYWMDNGDGTSSWDISDFMMTTNDMNIYLMEGTGEGQTLTYFNIPAGCSAQ